VKIKIVHIIANMDIIFHKKYKLLLGFIRGNLLKILKNEEIHDLHLFKKFPLMISISYIIKIFISSKP